MRALTAAACLRAGSEGHCNEKYRKLSHVSS
jgi:hypothetical protein